MASSILIDVLVVGGIGAALAALVTVAEHFLANYGPCTIAINDDKKVTTEGGGHVLGALTENKIFIPSACGGRGTCGLCKVKVLEGGGPLLPTEEPLLTDQEKKDHVRLSCQVKLRNDIRIEIPQELFSIREYEAECTRITDLTHDMKLFRFEPKGDEPMDYVPGQYVQLLTPVYEKSNEEVYRAYSIAGDPADRGAIELIIRLVPGGICTTYCFEYLRQGDKVKFNGPYGEFRLSRSDSPIIFIAGGSGMAPIRCILYQMRNEGIKRRAMYYFGANKVDELCLVDEMRRFEQELEGFQFVPCVASPEAGWEGRKGLVTEVVRRDVSEGQTAEAYLCGSPGMIDASIEVLKTLGVTEDRIFYDKFT